MCIKGFCAIYLSCFVTNAFNVVTAVEHFLCEIIRYCVLHIRLFTYVLILHMI